MKKKRKKNLGRGRPWPTRDPSPYLGPSALIPLKYQFPPLLIKTSLAKLLFWAKYGWTGPRDMPASSLHLSIFLKKVFINLFFFLKKIQNGKLGRPIMVLLSYLSVITIALTRLERYRGGVDDGNCKRTLNSD